MIRRNSQPICDELTAFFETLDGRYVDRLRTLIAFLYRRIVEDRVARETMRSLIAEGRRFPDLVDRHSAEVIQPFIERLRELLVAGIAAGEFRDTPALKFAENILSPMMLLRTSGACSMTIAARSTSRISSTCISICCSTGWRSKPRIDPAIKSCRHFSQ